MASGGLRVTLQMLPGFFSNCLFLALYDSVVLLKAVVSLLSCSRAAGRGARRRMLTSAGLRSVWRSFLLDAYKQVMETTHQCSYLSDTGLSKRKTRSNVPHCLIMR